MSGESRAAAQEPRQGGRIVAEVLARNGVDRVFSVPGESFLPVLDALHDTPSMQLVVCRQEGGASMMAEAYAKATGRPSACFVTRGPGSSNAMAGLHVAAQDATPLLLFVGQVPAAHGDRGAWQEVDLRAQFAAQAKWAAQVHDASRLAEYVSRAFYVATSGRPGPVVLALPEDVLYAPAAPDGLKPWQRGAGPCPAPSDVQTLKAWLDRAQAPLMIVGGGGWSRATQQAVEAFAERHAVPVASAFRRQDYFDNQHPAYAGEAGLGVNPALAERMAAADVLLVAGARLGDVTTRHYSLVEAPRPRQRLIHVHADSAEPGHVYQPDLAICAAPQPFAEALADLPANPAPGAARRQRVVAAHQDYLAWTTPGAETHGRLLAEIVAWLSESLDSSAVISNGAGNYTLWVQRFFRYRQHGMQLAPTSGSMGYGLPAAIAAALADPSRTAVCFAGDGCLLMTSQELATVAHYGVKVIIVVVNNDLYGSIRMHQQRQYPGRTAGTALTNPDFLTLARAFGLDGCRVDSLAAFQQAFAKAQAGERSALIEVRLGPDVLTP